MMIPITVHRIKRVCHGGSDNQNNGGIRYRQQKRSMLYSPGYSSAVASMIAESVYNMPRRLHGLSEGLMLQELARCR